MTSLDPRLAVERLDHAAALDGVVTTLRGLAGRALPRGRVKDALHGTWLGHPLHPMLTDLPIGCWTNAMLLDLWGGRATALAADRLVLAGVALALPTAAAGVADWSEADRATGRTGAVHAAANTVALALYVWSYAARRRGRRGQGVALSFLGAGAATVGGFLGGHLSYRLGAGVSRNAGQDAPGEWVTVVADDQLPAATPVRVDARGTAVLLYRDGRETHAMSDVCSHLGGPLHEGRVEGDGDSLCVTCPWHGSRFRLADGGVVAGPAQSPVPAFDARVDDGRVLVRRRVG